MPSYPHTPTIMFLIIIVGLLFGGPALLSLGCRWGGYSGLSDFFGGMEILLLTPLGCVLGGGVIGYFVAQYLAGIARAPNGGDPRIVQASIMVGLPLWCAGAGGLLGLIVDVGLLVKWW